jgi:hydroxymethylpyrimidine/phosphomethylpyrimidine kinase
MTNAFLKGMLSSAETVDTIAEAFADYGVSTVVLDPVSFIFS